MTHHHFTAARTLAGGCFAIVMGIASSAWAETGSPPPAVQEFLELNCLGCHDSATAEAGLDLESLEFNLHDRATFDRWTLIHDRVRDGEMPPPDDGTPQPVAAVGWSSRGGTTDSSAAGGGSSTALQDDQTRESRQMLVTLANSLNQADRQRIARTGRAKVRRLNRYEYENTLRQILRAPWLHVAHLLPEDGVDHLFNKVGERLDVSHVQLSRYLETADRALRLAVDAAAYPTETQKFYAREEPTLRNYLHYRFGQRSATRSIVPLVGTTPEPDVIRKLQPVSVGEADPEKREQEAMGVFSGTYSATTKYDFTRIDAPIDGHYRLRFKTYTFMAGPNGASGGNDHGLTGGRRTWWRPDRNVAFPAVRSEPVTLYALAPSGDSRWLATFDSLPKPTVFEAVVSLRKGEGIRPDAARLVRTRPGWSGNPNATEAGVPGFAMNWLEVEGPLHQHWPPDSYRAVFGELPFEVIDGSVKVQTEHPQLAGRSLIMEFCRRVIDRDADAEKFAAPYIEIFKTATQLGQDFTDAMISAISAVLCSPEFLYLDARPGPLPEQALQERLGYFLWNGPIDQSQEPNGGTPYRVDSTTQLRQTVDRMLDDPRRDRFVDAFLDYWLDLRDINANTPDATLYPDYYLDELLTESSVLETRRFFSELIDKNLPVRTLIDSDFAFINERLAEHYGLPATEGVALRRVELPDESPRGGLLTQASVMRVTANGTTTSPVIRGAWIMERLIGVEIPSPPSGVAAVEPDIRGAETIREQLEKHRSIESCNACHARFDPAGFALESFDVAGGWRDRYRSVGDEGDEVEGIGKNGHSFEFRAAQEVDCSGRLASGDTFADIRELKRLLAKDDRRIARNLLHQLIVYATGAPVTFGDRREVEEILDRAMVDEYGVRTLIHELVQSDLFHAK